MKKLTKLQINPERMMKNDELIKLKGGEGRFSCRVDCDGYPDWLVYYAQMCDPTDVDCAGRICEDFYRPVCEVPICVCVPGGEY
jgi:hypothetical protein